MRDENVGIPSSMKIVGMKEEEDGRSNQNLLHEGDASRKNAVETWPERRRGLDSPYRYTIHERVSRIRWGNEEERGLEGRVGDVAGGFLRGRGRE